MDTFFHDQQKASSDSADVHLSPLVIGDILVVEFGIPLLAHISVGHDSVPKMSLSEAGVFFVDELRSNIHLSLLGILRSGDLVLDESALFLHSLSGQIKTHSTKVCNGVSLLGLTLDSMGGGSTVAVSECLKALCNVAH